MSYGYDAAGRRTAMTVAGQGAVSYAWDDANRLTQIAQGADTVNLAYDAASRRTTLTLANGIAVEYGYDNANQLVSLTYKQGTTVLGDLSYAYVRRRAAHRQGREPRRHRAARGTRERQL